MDNGVISDCNWQFKVNATRNSENMTSCVMFSMTAYLHDHKL